MTLAEGVHELREGGGALDLEEDLVVVVRDLDVQVLALGLIVGVAAGTRRLITVRHGVDAGIVLCCIVVDGGESVGGRRGSCERRVQGFCCHQVLICVRLVSEEDLFALVWGMYLRARRDLIKIEPVLECTMMD